MTNVKTTSTKSKRDVPRPLIDEVCQQLARNTRRVYRGGLTKDAANLSELPATLRYVQKRGDLHLVWIGKMAIKHIPTMKELQHRRLLESEPIVPLYLPDSTALQRLERVRNGSGSVMDLLSRTSIRNGVTR